MRRVRESCPSRGAPGECEPTTACQILQRLTCRSLRHNVEYLASPSNVEGQLSGAQPGLCTRIVSNTAPAKSSGYNAQCGQYEYGGALVVPGHNRCWPFCRGLCRPLVLHATFLILLWSGAAGAAVRNGGSHRSIYLFLGRYCRDGTPQTNIPGGSTCTRIKYPYSYT